jgi:heterodisulfide reductase subunit A
MQDLPIVTMNSNETAQTSPAAAMVIGGGIAGMRSALDLADAGLKVYLVEQTPCLGGRVAQLGYMFPQHDCVCAAEHPTTDTAAPGLPYLPHMFIITSTPISKS